MRVVVIPFGVPDDGRGLGLGLAALVHSFARVDGEQVALAQLHARRADEAAGASSPVEAFVPPKAWRDLTGAGNAPTDVTLVLTGAFEPPTEGRGMIQILAFDGRDGATRARVEAHVDDRRAGATVLRALRDVCAQIGVDVTAALKIDELEWDALESVLRAERCALHDPARGGAHDRLAAMLHLGRAVGDAPGASFPAGRLATIALETASGRGVDPRMAQAALRALERAADDAPDQLELVEAMAALEVRCGAAKSAEARMNAVIAADPKRPHAYSLLSEALRARKDYDGALAALEAGQQALGAHPLLATARGLVFADRGEVEAAVASWMFAVQSEPLHAAAFANLVEVAIRRKDATLAQSLVDRALAAREATPDLLHRAMRLALSAEPPGIARAARVEKLARSVLARAPLEPWATLILARVLFEQKDERGALERITELDEAAAGTIVGAEAQRLRLAIEEPRVSMELEAALRAASSGAEQDLVDVAARARHLGTLYRAWLGWAAAGVAEKRLGHWRLAREAFEAALALAVAAPGVRAELVAACVALGDTAGALKNAERAVALEGENPRTLGALAHAEHAAGRPAHAERTIARALAIDQSDAANRALAETIGGGWPSKTDAPKGLLKRAWDRVRGR